MCFDTFIQSFGPGVSAVHCARVDDAECPHCTSGVDCVAYYIAGRGYLIVRVCAADCGYWRLS